MAGASRQDTVRGADFAVDRIEAADGRLVVSGRWSGVRGMRFMRPTLVLGDRQILAVLEHKPWAPDADPWVAAFPWDGEAVDRDAMELSVAPSVMVALGDKPPTEEPSDDGLAVERLQSEVRFLRSELDARAARSTRLESVADEERRAAQDATAGREDLELARRDAERERDNALAQLAEAVADREAAVRTRARMEAQRDEADAERAALVAERDDVLERVAELHARLDETLLANRTLQQQLQATLAASQPAAAAPAAPAARPDDEDPDQPIGTRSIPASRVVAPHLHRSPRAGEVGASAFDVWAIRVLGVAAAICFILLLVMFIRLFV
jgi:hypothetical protein